jgi:predicted dehydrogenase
MALLRGLCIGAGYFSRFHLDAWQRVEDVEIVGICDLSCSKAAALAEEFQLAQAGQDALAMLDALQVDFVDIITPPATHLPLVRSLAPLGPALLCQKPLAPTFDDARELVAVAQQAGTRLMVHENFRFQPWYREIKRLLDSGSIGSRLHGMAFRSRMGDGWGERAYLDRQPYFRDMPRLLIYENGVHFIDTFRYLAGEIEGVYAVVQRLNPVIQGEDRALVMFEFASGATGLWDANRYNECNDPDPRYTFGEFLVEADGGALRLGLDGRLTIQPLGKPEQDHAYHHERRGFAGDCVYSTLRHFVDCLRSGDPFETPGEDYLKTLAVQEAVYESAACREPVRNIAQRWLEK